MKNKIKIQVLNKNNYPKVKVISQKEEMEVQSAYKTHAGDICLILNYPKDQSNTRLALINEVYLLHEYQLNKLQDLIQKDLNDQSITLGGEIKK